MEIKDQDWHRRGDDFTDISLLTEIVKPYIMPPPLSRYDTGPSLCPWSIYTVLVNIWILCFSTMHNYFWVLQLHTYEKYKELQTHIQIVRRTWHGVIGRCKNSTPLPSRYTVLVHHVYHFNFVLFVVMKYIRKCVAYNYKTGVLTQYISNKLIMNNFVLHVKRKTQLFCILTTKAIHKHNYHGQTATGMTNCLCPHSYFSLYLKTC
jgi:hypothetical protein